MLTYQLQLLCPPSVSAAKATPELVENVPSRRSKSPRETSTQTQDARSREFACELNRKMGADCADRERTLFVFRQEESLLSAVLLARREPLAPASVAEDMRAFFGKCDGSEAQEIEIAEIREITVETFCQRLRDAEKAGFLRDAAATIRNLSLELFPNRRFQDADDYRMEEFLTTPAADKAESLARAKRVMAHPSLTEELDRIYCPQNTLEFIGHPVHYRISADCFDAAREITETLVAALCGRGRLKSRRVNYCTHIDAAKFREDSWERIIGRSRGSTLVVETAGLMKEKNRRGFRHMEPEEVAKRLAEEAFRHRQDTLFIFVEPSKKTADAECAPMKLLKEKLTLVPLAEGEGNGEKARDYLTALAEDEGSRRFIAAEAKKLLSDTENYTATKLRAVYESLSQKYMLHSYYPSYCALAEAKAPDKDKADAFSEASYEELQRLVGLSPVKALVDRILAAHRMFRLRQGWGLDPGQGMPHMVFTGNPGSAKTTVARLLAGVLKERGLLPEGKFVECGRADLVGQYVGWTAKIVRSKFSEAKGGVLFIDEAYSLVDNKRGMFGDEAIHTIVQEMENHRGDVLVIFAGYTDRMRAFIERNEGLRSRIAFHVDFPDYDEDELLKILNLMAKKKGYRLSRGSEEKCLALFREACRQKDFGNGRFVRNLLEDAALRQAERLSAKAEKGQVTKRMAQTLCEEDFAYNATMFGVEGMKRRTAGFLAG